MRKSAKSLHGIQHTATFVCLFALQFLVIANDGADQRVASGAITTTGIERTVPETTVPSAAVTAPTTTAPTTTTTVALETSTTTTTTTTTTTLRPLDPVTFESLARIDTILDYTDFTTQGPSRWRSSIDGLEELDLTSTADGAQQPVFWLPPAGDHDQPVLVILHSWSSRYTQHAGIPFAQWAQENGWAMIAPEFRGENDDPDSVGSALAVQDVADAIDFAVAQDGVDEDRVFVVGYSGGGMMALLAAGHHPEKVTAVSAWGPPHDLEQFYDFARWKGLGYWDDIRRACGGDPRQEGEVQDECRTRSPATYLDVLREHEVPVFVGQGINDPFVMRNAAAEVFNGLADPEDQLSEEDVDLLRGGRVPGDASEAVTIETHFEDRDPDPVFARASGSALLVYFRAGHDMVYGAAAEWFATDPR